MMQNMCYLSLWGIRTVVDEVLLTAQATTSELKN
jgi:hypothetical protein